MVTDAVDFFVFGGSGSRLAQRFGISETSFQYDPARNRVGAVATFADRVELEVETEASVRAEEPLEPTTAASDAVPGKAYKVGAAYKLTEPTSLGIEHGREPIAQRTRATTGAEGGSPAPDADETLLLKVKKRF